MFLGFRGKPCGRTLCATARRIIHSLRRPQGAEWKSAIIGYFTSLTPLTHQFTSLITHHKHILAHLTQERQFLCSGSSGTDDRCASSRICRIGGMLGHKLDSREESRLYFSVFGENRAAALCVQPRAELYIH